ncbi:sensor histidine kinase [Wenyingzhuangia sp. IMCC45574]
MASKNFYYLLIFRILLLTILLFVLNYCILKEHYILAVLTALLSIGLSINLVRFLNQTNRKIAYFFDALKNEDFTLQFPEDKKQQVSLNELHTSLNKVNSLIKNIQLKYQSQENYYQEILKHTKTGILTINQKGHILFANPASKTLFHKPQLNHIRQLESTNSNLYRLLESFSSFDRKLINFNNERESLELVVKSIDLVLNSEHLKLITLENIKSELDEKETESWSRLIQVLAHEIMNTITPISSISNSIITYFKNNEEPLDEQQTKNTVKGLEVIKSQSDDLMSFVDAYRSLMNIPTPDKSIINGQDFFDKLAIISKENYPLVTFQFNITEPDFELFADEKLITLVLSNLIKNAVQATKETKQPLIEISAGLNEQNQKYIAVKDNGTGISEDLQQQIFIPFFTTKTNGSGIGLSLSKQILKLHGGRLSLHSVLDEGSTFVLFF